ncbi:MAG: hypothetical protein J7M25_01295 [Deltaproteobacteria bacterium]|nr:hypothetical protein [Deltaproteobacteria bacterium]
MKRLGVARVAFAISFAVVSFGVGGRAEAKILELWLQAQGGGMYGMYGTEKYDPASSISPAQDDFFRAHSGGLFGAQAGIELFFVDVVVDFAQFYDHNGLSGTLTSFMLGFDWDFAIGRRWEVTPFGLVGFGLATFDNSWLRKEYPQIDKADLSARAALVRVGARLEFKIVEMLRLGVEAGVGYHYEIATDKAANDLEGHSHGFHGYVMGLVRFQWEPFRHRRHRRPTGVVVPGPPAPVASPQQPAPVSVQTGTRQPPASGPRSKVPASSGTQAPGSSRGQAPGTGGGASPGSDSGTGGGTTPRPGGSGGGGSSL